MPKQYGLDHNAKVTQSDDVDRLTNCIQSYDIADDVTITDDDGGVRFEGMVKSVKSPLQIKAHLKWQERVIGHTSSHILSHAICDSGADSCVVGKMAKIIGITSGTANLVGYNPQTTKSGTLPIVSALLKTVSADNVPLLLRVNEAVYS